MGRPWVKLSSSIYRHFELCLVSDSAFRRFIECITLAGDLDDDDEGRVGPWAGVARQLHINEEQLRSDISELGGRIVEVDGNLYVRDWPEHQSPKRAPEPNDKVAERVRKHRARLRVDGGNDDVTQSLLPPSRTGNAPLEVEESRREERKNGAGKPARPDQLMFDSLCGWRGLDGGGMTGNMRGRVNKLGKALRDAGYSAADVDAAAKAWWSGHWKGQRGEPPSWSDAEEWMSRASKAARPWVADGYDDA